jgi:hypothetical protein
MIKKIKNNIENTSNKEKGWLFIPITIPPKINI